MPAVSRSLLNLPHVCTAVLKGIEEAKAKGFKPHEVQEKARKLANEHLKVPEKSAVAVQYIAVPILNLQSQSSPPQALDPKQNLFKDHASHFVLRLAYCRTEELRRWFLTHESELFKARFSDEPPKAQASPISLFNTTASQKACDPALLWMLFSSHQIAKLEAANPVLKLSPSTALPC